MSRTLRQSSQARRVLGFTLIEVLMVAAAILILITIGVPNFVNALKRAKIASAKVQLLSYKAALEQYHTDTRKYPESGSEHFYYALSGLAPFNQKTSRRYHPPYYDFDAALIGKPSDYSDYDTEYNENPIFTISQGDSSENKAQLDLSTIRPVIPYPGVAGDGVPFHPIVDPWGRPVVYISPVDLRREWNDEANPWSQVIAISDETRFNDNGVGRNVPFDLNSGQFWSAGPDAVTAEQQETSFGLFQPGNLLGGDGRDNDGDGLSDASDNKAKDTNHIAEDDISSWSP